MALRQYDVDMFDPVGIVPGNNEPLYPVFDDEDNVEIENQFGLTFEQLEV